MTAIRKPIFVLPLDLVAIAASDATAGHPAANLARPNMLGLTWSAPGLDTAWLRGQFDGAQLVDFCAMISASITPGAQYRLRLGTSQAEVDGNAAAYDQTLPFVFPAITRPDGLYHSHLELPAPVNASWWRIDFSDLAGPIELSSIVFGKAIEPSRYYDKDFERGVEDLGSVELNRFAVPDVTPGVKLRRLQFTLSWLNEDEYETLFAPLAEVIGTTRVVYCCFDPAETPYRQARTYLGWLSNPPFARGGVKPRNMAMEFQLRSLI